MPELPEVETIRRDLAPEITGRYIAGVTLHRVGNAVVVPRDEDAWRRRGVGREISGVRRRARHLLIELSGGDLLVVHLQMTGRLFLREPGAPADDTINVTLTLDDGRELRFGDLRGYARFELMTAAEWAAREVRLRPEPLSDGFTPEALEERLSRHKKPIKTLLLDQGFVAGLGNIYADEALFKARLDPRRPANSLAPDEIDRLYRAIRRVLERGIANRSTTVATYRDAFGCPGINQRTLAVFQRQGQPCLAECGGSVERTKVGGRDTHFCPLCQR